MAETSRRSGASAVEFALIAPLFLVLIFGIIEFGMYFHALHTLKHACREGSRLGMVGGTVGGEDRTGSIIKIIKDRASTAVNKDKIDIRIFEVNPDYSDPVGWETTPPGAGDPEDFMRIKLRYTYKFINLLIGVFFSGGGQEILTEITYKNEKF
ncbi:MAG: pilus assembly protein [Kiritimatiellia bacterium]|nr:pilus assembly protein [Kiritimatiellia bacterium]